MEAVVVAPEHVARDVEAVLGDRPLDVRPVVIARHHGRAFHLKHALPRSAVGAVDQTQQHFGMWIANRHFRLRKALRMRTEHHRPGFRRAIGVDDQRLRHRPLDRTHKALADGRRAHAQHLDARQVGLRDQRVLAQHHRDHRRHRGEHRAAMRLDRADVVGGDELRQQHHCRVPDRGELCQCQSIHMIERSSDQVAMALEILRPEPRFGHPDVALVAENHTLRYTARARRVEKHRRLIPNRHHGLEARGADEVGKQRHAIRHGTGARFRHQNLVERGRTIGQSSTVAEHELGTAVG